MSTKQLYRAFGCSHYSPVDCHQEDGVFVLEMECPREKDRCSGCGSRDVIRRGSRQRQVVAPPLALQTTKLLINVPRLECRNCGRVLQAATPNVVPGCNYTRAFARLVVSLRPMMTIKDIAMYLGVSESMIRGIDKRYLKRNFGRPKLKRLKVLAIDEIYIGKAKKFLTIVIDWTTGAIVFVGEGKGEKALKSFWKRLQGSGAKIEAVATDMSSAYFAAVQKNLPNAKLVFDRFHIVKLMNEKLDQLRREVQNEADTMLKKTIKGLRWLLLKHSDNLDPARNEAQRLQEALELNRSLHIGYYLKEDLAQIWTQGSKTSAAIFLDDWCRRARATGIRVLQTMANTLQGHRTGILNWYDYPISSGPMEGVNNKIGALQRAAYGYRDQHYFILKLFALHEAKFKFLV